jgi:hypothetical protein
LVGVTNDKAASNETEWLALSMEQHGREPPAPFLCGLFPASWQLTCLPTYLIKITKTSCRIPPVSASTPPPALHTISLEIETRAEETEGPLRQFCAPPFSSHTLDSKLLHNPPLVTLVTLSPRHPLSDRLADADHLTSSPSPTFDFHPSISTFNNKTQP